MGRRALVAANWKMHGRQAQIADLSQALLVGLFSYSSLEVVICPPSLYLAQVRKALQESALQLGAQNLHQAEKGAFTGEISAPMLKDVGCAYVIVGHSERRDHERETDVQVAAKFVAARAGGLRPILCVGESAAQRDAGTTDAVVTKQVQTVLQAAGVAAFAAGTGACRTGHPGAATGPRADARPRPPAHQVLTLLRYV